MSRAVLCPVCNGKGQVIPNWDVWDGKTLMDCHGCSGKGWVEVSDNPGNIVGYCINNDYTKCPACGGDRNSLGLTSCPKVSHYWYTQSEVQEECRAQS